MSRQALIFKRRQTQQRSSCEEGLPGEPHTIQREGPLELSTDIEALALAIISLGTTGSGLCCGLRLDILLPTIVQNAVWLQASQIRSARLYAASSRGSTTAASSTERHRGHLCPGTTRTLFFNISMLAGTLW